jgi:NAD(P)-dependent dehydrogenase (short-subunit alcohol dehydrogenase family)
VHLDDLNWHNRKYSKWAAYGESKLAIMLFTDELARRGIRAIAVDPGGADTNIVRYSTGFLGFSRELGWPRNFPQSAKTAARSSIIGATEDLPSGTYLAPVFKQFGKPRVTKPVKKARDADTAARLWQLSADLTECDWSR